MQKTLTKYSSIKKSTSSVINKKPSPWWKGAVIYQVYPRSFMDTTHTGMGDLKGITQKLNYLAKLNVDAVWISPFFTSPMKDFGYDVSNYCDVDPSFGTLADFKNLVRKAKSLGIRIIIDQVLSHTSDQHPWFMESRGSHTNPKADWYVWADASPGGSPPNNWLSIFGGSAWQWDTKRKQYYLHNFLKEQPDLNFHNPTVRKALLQTVEFWLKLGVDGFRLDTVNFYYHSETLRSNPPCKPNTAAGVSEVNPYSYQRHIYDKSRPENIRFLEDFRKLLDRYSKPGKETFAVGEIGDDNPLSIISDYTKGSKRLHTCYTFDFLGLDFSAQHFKYIIESYERKVKQGWICWSFSNHDVARVATRWGKSFKKLSPQSKRAFTKMLFAVQIALKGTICIYQGDELGLSEGVIPYEKLQDPYGIEMYPEFAGRDGCRTPMVWDRKKPQAGFSKHQETWLPIPKEHLPLAVSEQEKNPHSLLAFYRKLVAFRKQHAELLEGKIKVLSTPKLIEDNILVLERGAEPSTSMGSIRLVVNLTVAEQVISSDSPLIRLAQLRDLHPGNLLISQGVHLDRKNNLVLKPFSFGFFKVNPKDIPTTKSKKK